jgi:hypothetical protein
MQLRRLKRRLERAYSKSTKGLRINKAGGEKRDELRKKFWIDLEDINGGIAQLESRYLVDAAERVMLPQTEESDWTDHAEAAPYFFLKREAMARLRAAIRQERNERFDSGMRWVPPLVSLITAIAGLLGILAGVLAVLKK